MLSERINSNSIAPGIYDIDNESYHRGPGISRSGIVTFRKSPFHYWAEYIRPQGKEENSTASKELGSIVHALVLEPHEFIHRYFVIEQEIDRRTREGKALWAKAMQDASQKMLVEADVYQQAILMRDAVLNHPDASNLLKGAQIEKTIYWIDPDTNILCKCRPDALFLSDSINYACDLKTSKDGSPRAFKFDIDEYGYHIQAAMVSEGCKHALNIDMRDFLHAIVESKDPYAVAVYPLDQRSLEQGRKLFKKALCDLKECLEADKWPSYETQEISLPEYIFNL